MGSWRRRLRGTAGTGLTWAVGWFGLSSVAWSAVLWGDAPLGMIFDLAVGVGVAGLLAGVGFAVVVGLAEGHRTLDDLSFARFALWGALGGLLVSLPFVGSVAPSTYAAFFGGLGATSAAGTLALARMGDDPDSLAAGGRRALSERTD